MNKSSKLIPILFGLLYFCFSASVVADPEECQSGCDDPTPAATFFGYADVGNGRKIYMECQGTGKPTVILLSGLGNRTDAWKESNSKQFPSVFFDVSTYTRVCAYDRPGTIHNTEKVWYKSRSDRTPQPISASEAAKDLHTLLEVSNQPGPYILVGHSFGGVIARAYINEYPKKVAGLVLVDALAEGLHKRMSSNDWYFYDKILNGVPNFLVGYKEFERADYMKSFEHLKPVNPKLPVIVITADRPPDFEGLGETGILQHMPAGFPNRLWDAQMKAQKELANSFHGAKHITQTNSGHYVQIEQPQIVSESIREMVNRVRR